MNSRKLIGNAIITTAIGIIIARSKKDKIVFVDTLPQIIKDYVKIHFPAYTIKKAVKSKDIFNRTYDVFLDGKINLEFNKRGEIIEIEANSKLPDSVIPEKIIAFVAAYFPDNSIIEWELERRTQEVELDNGLELLFDLNDDFLSIDN
jgi:hypothetical protein